MIRVNIRLFIIPSCPRGNWLAYNIPMHQDHYVAVSCESRRVSPGQLPPDNVPRTVFPLTTAYWTIQVKFKYGIRITAWWWMIYWWWWWWCQTSLHVSESRLSEARLILVPWQSISDNVVSRKLVLSEMLVGWMQRIPHKISWISAKTSL